MTALLASFLFYSGMKDYVKVGKTDIAVVELYEDYPAVNLAKQIWENYQSDDEIADLCFAWNGGVQVVTNPEDFRQANARVTGVVGMAALYDRQAALLEENDETGCVIDKDTALELFGSENCAGSQLTVGEQIYEVRGVVSWNQHMILIRPPQKNLVCTQVLIRGKKGQELEGAASDFLVGNGLSGILVDDSWLEVILPWFPVTFLVMLIRTVSRWLYEMERGTWENGIQRSREKKIDFRKCSCFVIRILLWGIGLFFCVRLLSHIPQSWLPDKWSDFSFWPAKLRKSFPLVHHVPENYGAGGAADERNWLYYKMWGSSTAYRGGVGCLFFFFAKRILQMKKYFGTFFSRLFFKVFARLERRYYNRL